MKKKHTLRLILGDQLNAQHSWYETVRDEVLYVFCEVRSETDYVAHHIQKVVGIFLAMRHFADELRQKGHYVTYIALDEMENKQSFEANLTTLFEQYDIQAFEYQLPDEYRLDKVLKEFGESLNIPVKAVDTEHFLTKRDDLQQQFGEKKFLMETFYRKMRQKHAILMEIDGKTPLTGKWNFDAENRKKLPKNVAIPAPLHFCRDVTDLVRMITQQGVKTIGRIKATNFTWNVTRAESLELLENFIKLRLAAFGTYEDAMTQRDYWLFHSKLSFALNLKLLSPLEVVQAAVAHWQTHQETVSLAQIEGFTRQIIGWREYMRGIYWAKMPEFATLNFFEHQAKLPVWFWTGETKMNCLQHTITGSLQHAYAHHIQRLMITGAFALLLGAHPDEVDAWYLGIYIDAFDWVEITNTRGMSQFADGGMVGTKPYIGSANYIHKMSDYCDSCKYDKNSRYGENACPYNSLYWDFYMRHEAKLRQNPRIGMMYPLLDKMSAAEKASILAQAEFYKQNVDSL